MGIIQGLGQTYSLSIVLECKIVQSTNIVVVVTAVPKVQASRVGADSVLKSSNSPIFKF